MPSNQEERILQSGILAGRRELGIPVEPLSFTSQSYNFEITLGSVFELVLGRTQTETVSWSGGDVIGRGIAPWADKVRTQVPRIARLSRKRAG